MTGAEQSSTFPGRLATVLEPTAFRFSFDEPQTRVSLALRYVTPVLHREVVLVFAALDAAAADVTSSCPGLQWSDKLGSRFVYAPAAGPGVIGVGDLDFTSSFTSLSVTPLTWPGAGPVGPAVVDRAYASFPSGTVRLGIADEDVSQVVVATRGSGR